MNNPFDDLDNLQDVTDGSNAQAELRKPSGTAVDSHTHVDLLIEPFSGKAPSTPYQEGEARQDPSVAYSIYASSEMWDDPGTIEEKED